MHTEQRDERVPNEDAYLPFEDGRWHVRIPINGRRQRFGSFPKHRKADAIRKRDEILAQCHFVDGVGWMSQGSIVVDKPMPAFDPEATIYPPKTTSGRVLPDRGGNIQFHSAFQLSNPDIDPGIYYPPVQKELDFASIEMARNGGPRAQPVLTIPRTNLLVLGDLHVPYHNTTMLRRAVYVVKRHFPHIEDIVVIGDWWDFGVISRHPKDEMQAALDEEIEVSGQVGRALLKHFKRAWITNGNHCQRMARKLDTPLHLKHLYGMAFGRDWPECEMHITDLDYLYADSPDGDPYKNWLLGHPRNYSGQGGKTPSDIAALEHRNVATGHNHIIGTSASKCGRYIGVDVGHSTEPQRHAYVRNALTKYSRWNAGFLVISNGYPYHFTERFTDWKMYGCE